MAFPLGRAAFKSSPDGRALVSPEWTRLKREFDVKTLSRFPFKLRRPRNRQKASSAERRTEENSRGQSRGDGEGELLSLWGGDYR
jgi:hypothetical protein